MKLFAYRPHQDIILLLYRFWNTPQSDIQSNYPAMAKRCEELQNGIINAPSYHGDAPQERTVDQRSHNRKIKNAIANLSTRHQEILEAAYSPPNDSRLELPLTPLLAGLARFSRLRPLEHLDQPKIMACIRMELDELWCDAHKAFEVEWKRCST